MAQAETEGQQVVVMAAEAAGQVAEVASLEATRVAAEAPPVFQQVLWVGLMAVVAQAAATEVAEEWVATEIMVAREGHADSARPHKSQKSAARSTEAPRQSTSTAPLVTTPCWQASLQMQCQIRRRTLSHRSPSALPQILLQLSRRRTAATAPRPSARRRHTPRRHTAALPQTEVSLPKIALTRCQ